MIKFENVTKTYDGGFQAVKTVDFEIHEAAQSPLTAKTSSHTTQPNFAGISAMSFSKSGSFLIIQLRKTLQ
jgi:ABC-type proline/glycine betaine transport system ATPase subunit